MKKFALLADTQFHPWNEVERGQQRWLDMTYILRDVLALAKNEQCDGIIHFGDLFESKRSIRSDVAAAVYSELKAWARSGIPCHFIAGNHDLYNTRYNHTALDLPRKFITHTTPGWIDEEHGLYALPYGNSVSSNLDYVALCSHIDIRGASMGSGMLSSSSGVDERLFKRRKSRQIVFNGHYHIPQLVRLSKKHVPVQCLGSPFHHNWNDARYSKKERGLWILGVGNGKVDYVRVPPNRYYPRFIAAGDSASAKRGDFVQQALEAKQTQRLIKRTVVDRDPSVFIRGYVCGKVGDKKQRKSLIQRGLELSEGSE